MIFVQMKMPKWLGTLVLLSTLQFEQIKIVKSWLILLCWIRIQPTKIDADPCGSGSGSETLLEGEAVLFKFVALLQYNPVLPVNCASKAKF